MHDSVGCVRAASIHALANLEADPERIVTPLLRLLKSEKDDSVREAVNNFFRVQKSGGDRIVPVLVSLVKENGELQDAAILALGAMGPAANRALPVLKEALKDAPLERGTRLQSAIQTIEARMPVPPLGYGLVPGFQR